MAPEDSYTLPIIHPESGQSKAVVVGEMPLYRSHKQVRALEIARLEDDGVGGVTMFFVTGDYRPASERLFIRYLPLAGDFFVVYDDGYESISPRKAFLDGYTLIGDVAPSGDPG